MKHANAYKKLLFASLIGMSSAVHAQAPWQAPWFGYVGADSANFYKNYVGVRFEVVNPGSIAGNKIFSEADPYGGGGEGWTDMPGVTTPIVNVAIAMPPLADSCACTGLVAGTMTGKIAVIWRGPESGACEFGYKASQAQNAGAIACVIINEYAGGEPIGMAAATYGAGVSIPTFMIGNEDGIAITNAYKAELLSSSTTDSVRMTITPWGLELQNDLGFFNGSSALWHDYAIPYNQLTGTNNGVPYMGMHGAFIANFGTNTESHVRLAGTAVYTTADGSSSTIISDTSAVLNSFPALDSIYAFFSPQYNFSVSTDGSVHVTYYILQDSVDQYPNDDSTSFTFFVTDSLYSKGRYDFANKVPLSNLYEAANPFSSGDSYYTWGDMYYVRYGGSSALSVQWSMEGASGTTISSLGGIPVNIYLLKWVDGSSGYPMDSFMQVGELQLAGIAVETFALPGDTAGGNFTTFFTSDTTVTGTEPVNYPPALDSDSWYYVAVEVPVGWFLGCDGITNLFPRTFGRNHAPDNYLEYYSPVYQAGRPTSETDGMLSTAGAAGTGPGYTFTPCPFGSGDGNYYTDSVVFNNQIGLVPSVAMNVTGHAISPPPNNGVKNVTQSNLKFDVYPNPTSDYVNVAIGLNSTAKVVTYTILDGMARDVYKESHYNVVNDNFTYSTTGLASGNYYMVVNVDNKAMFKKFTVIRN